MARTAASGAFLIGAGWTTAEAQVEKTDRLNAWLEIAPSGIVTVTTGRVEMGQGTYTSLAMLAIEELDYPWANVRVAHAPDSGDHTNLGMFYSPDGMPAPWMRTAARKVLGLQLTGGSMSVRDGWITQRIAGAAAQTFPSRSITLIEYDPSIYLYWFGCQWRANRIDANRTRILCQ